MQMAICILVISTSVASANQLIGLIAEKPEFDYNTTVTTSFFEAISVVQSTTPDVVIVDSSLSEKGAFEFLVQLKCAHSSIPVLALLPQQENTLVSNAACRFVDSCLKKDLLSSQQLIAAIEAIHPKATRNQLLPDNKHLFHALFENTNDAVIVCDLQGKIEMINPHGLQLLGYAEAEMMGHKLEQFAALQERTAWSENALRLLAGQRLPSFEQTYLSKDGSKVTVEINSSLVTNQLGIPSRYLNIARITAPRTELGGKIRTEQKLSEQQSEEQTTELQAVNQELNRVVRIKDQFVATVSHELRTPLAGMLNLSEAIQEGVYGPLNERQMTMLEKIRQSGQHLLALLNDILDISRVETQGLVLDLGEVYIEELCRNSLFLVQETARSRDIRLTVSINTQNKMLIADERRLTQIIVNLLGNAIKFTPRSGNVGINVFEGSDSLAEDTYSNCIHERTLNFEVWDTGVGIPAEEIPKLFQPFFQVQNRLPETNKGSGLGLTLVDKLVQLHGGKVSVHSVVGRGSRFIVSLPWRTSVSVVNYAPTVQSFPDVWTVT